MCVEYRCRDVRPNRGSVRARCPPRAAPRARDRGVLNGKAHRPIALGVMSGRRTRDPRVPRRAHAQRDIRAPPAGEPRNRSCARPTGSPIEKERARCGGAGHPRLCARVVHGEQLSGSAGRSAPHRASAPSAILRSAASRSGRSGCPLGPGAPRIADPSHLDAARRSSRSMVSRARRCAAGKGVVVFVSRQSAGEPVASSDAELIGREIAVRLLSRSQGCASSASDVLRTFRLGRPVSPSTASTHLRTPTPEGLAGDPPDPPPPPRTPPPPPPPPPERSGSRPSARCLPHRSPPDLDSTTS